MEAPAEVLQRSREFLTVPGRHLVGVTGPPGAGKSTFAAAVAEELPSVVVPMDGFHLTDHELARLGRAHRKGAPDTFDVHGYVSVLKRLRDETGHTVYAPQFDRQREESIASQIAVHPEHRLVLTEGNYLLLEEPGWSEVRGILDEVWYVEVDEPLRVSRLVARHVAHGRSPEAAAAWVAASDELNAEVIRPTRHLADLVIRLA